MRWRRQGGRDSLGTCLFSAGPQRETSRAAQCYGLIALLDDARKELASCAKWKAFTDDANAVACGQCEMIGLQQFCARIVRLSLRQNALRLLLRAKSHGNKHSCGEPSGNEAGSNQSVHFPFPTQESPVGSPKMSEQPNLERSALFVLILVGWALQRLRLRFWTPHVPKCKH